MEQSQQQHFLIAIYPMQSHINPSRHLARMIAHYTRARVTVSMPVSGHRKLFPSASPPHEEFNDGEIIYIPHSDGFDEGFQTGVNDPKDYWIRSRIVGFETISALLDRLKHEGKPVTHVIYSTFMICVPDIARAHGIPSVQFWIQPTIVLAICYYYCHGYKDKILSVANNMMAEIKFPCLPPLKIRDLPSYLTITDKNHPLYEMLHWMIQTIEALENKSRDGVMPKVLVNSFDELESDAIRSMEQTLDLISIGPMPRRQRGCPLASSRSSPCVPYPESEMSRVETEQSELVDIKDT